MSVLLVLYAEKALLIEERLANIYLNQPINSVLKDSNKNGCALNDLSEVSPFEI